ncbi:primosomal replication protein N [Vibrio navarrensis]|uniref:primosomal replication protein N n=1 Tax=Vibrio navarrensis TaxID=29495 RepID=UPI0020963332|nr:primosomal replication protein N [Vibrio navarrensis]
MTHRMKPSGIVAKDSFEATSAQSIAHRRESRPTKAIYCRRTLGISGDRSHEKTQQLVLGSNIKLSGFVAYQTGQHGVRKLVLHADDIIHI